MAYMEYVPIKDLILLEKNPRKIDKDQFSKLVKSLEQDPKFLECRPILINRLNGNLNVYAGNQRVRAAIKLNLKEVPCIIEDNIDAETINARIIKDNKTYGHFDFDILLNEWDVDILFDAGFTAEELTGDYGEVETIDTSEEENETLEPAKDEDAITKLGDVFELDGHRLVCGDSTLLEYTEKALNGLEPILMVTDPPYGVNYDPSWRQVAGKGCKAKGKVQNDGQVNWSLAWHLFPGSIAYIWHAGKFCAEVEKSLTDCEYEIISQIIWSKQNFALSRGDYHWKHEPCWYAVKKGHQHNWKGDRKQTTVWEIANLNCFGKSQEEDERTAHSTQKPLECMSRPIINHTDEGDCVYDPFLGSGTTLIAAEKLNRKCLGLELSPAYCDIIIKRWIKIRQKQNKSFEVNKNGLISKDFI